MESAIQSSCFDCVLRPDRPFCDLPTDALKAFDAIKTVNAYPRGTILFREGHPPRGIFLLCSGRAKLSLGSNGGKRLTFRTAGPGEVLGLSALLSGRPYEITAEIVDNAQVAVIRRKDLLRFLRDHRAACLEVVQLLSQDVHTAYDRVRSVGLGRARKNRLSRVH